jgi:pyruvate/2-oxoglutarate/acetoin dehydrogenase E1 component
MTYKERLTETMTWIGQQDILCVGYNICESGGNLSGTLVGVPLEKRIEMPVAEALMMGVSIGLALDGRVVLAAFDRFDFLLHAADQIVNHLDKMQFLTGRDTAGVIVRVGVGNRHTPLFSLPTHVQNLSNAFREMVDMPVHELRCADDIMPRYQEAYQRAKKGRPTMLVEFRDNYNS